MPINSASVPVSSAKHLWPPVRESLANRGFADLDALADRLAAGCRQLSADRPFVRGLTNFRWWPKRH